jgi:hypothetical protein
MLPAALRGTMSGFNLYEFPEGSSGTRRYVSVQGHSKSIPIIYTYKGTDGRNHVLPEYGGTDEFFAQGSTPFFLPSKLAYRSPIDGSTISSRKQHVDHMSAHNVIEVGNERWPTRTEVAPLPRAGHDIKRALDTARG